MKHRPVPAHRKHQIWRRVLRMVIKLSDDVRARPATARAVVVLLRSIRGRIVKRHREPRRGVTVSSSAQHRWWLWEVLLTHVDKIGICSQIVHGVRFQQNDDVPFLGGEDEEAHGTFVHKQMHALWQGILIPLTPSAAQLTQMHPIHQQVGYDVLERLFNFYSTDLVMTQASLKLTNVCTELLFLPTKSTVNLERCPS